MQPIEYTISSVNYLPRQKPTQIFYFIITLKNRNVEISFSMQ